MKNTKEWIDNLPKEYQGVRKTWRTWWEIYKETGSVLRSPYLHVSAILSLILFPWLGCGISKAVWFDLALGIFPNLMGFTLGGYAILVAFSDRTFMRKLHGREKDGRSSPYLELNAMFVHFILMQGAVILLAYMGKAIGLERGIFALLGTWVSIYAIFLAFSATLTVMRFADLYERFFSEDEVQDSDESTEK